MLWLNVLQKLMSDRLVTLFRDIWPVCIWHSSAYEDLGPFLYLCMLPGYHDMSSCLICMILAMMYCLIRNTETKHKIVTVSLPCHKLLTSAILSQWWQTRTNTQTFLVSKLCFQFWVAWTSWFILSFYTGSQCKIVQFCPEIYIHRKALLFTAI